MSKTTNRCPLDDTPVEIACNILSFCHWPDRGALLRLNKHWSQGVYAQDSTWRLLCWALHKETFVYVSHGPGTAWRDSFKRCWSMRDRWRPVSEESSEPSGVCTSASEYLERTRAGEVDVPFTPAWQRPQQTPKTFNIKVFARFRPVTAHLGAKDEQEDAGQHIVLPLYQQLRLLEQGGLSKEQARTRVFGESKGFFAGAGVEVPAPALSSPAAATDGPDGEAEGCADGGVVGCAEGVVGSIGQGLQERVPGVVSVAPKEVVMCAPGVGLRRFRSLDGVLQQDSMQTEVYDAVARPQVFEFLNGLNTTVLLYGQTGSGKTYTSFGPTASVSSSLRLEASSGLVPRVCAEVLGAVAERRGFGMRADLAVSYIEIYGDEVTDLLQEGAAVGAWQGTAVRAVLEGRAKVAVRTVGEMEAALKKGEGNKRRASTAMNERSSRAHALLFLSLVQTPPGQTSFTVTSTMCLADLGGCEQLKKSNVSGQQLAEAVKINQGLLALKQCINGLNKGHPFIPYHDSKLTQILSSSLGGSSRTTVVVACSMEGRHASESMQALRFGEKCAVVTNESDRQSSSTGLLLAGLDRDIRACREQIKKKERWETRVEERKDVDGDEQVVKSSLVGAEQEGKELARLLEARRQLVGGPKGPTRKIRQMKAYAPQAWCTALQ